MINTNVCKMQHKHVTISLCIFRSASVCLHRVHSVPHTVQVRALLHPMRDYNDPQRPKHYQSYSSPASAHYLVINERPGEVPPCMTNDQLNWL